MAEDNTGKTERSRLVRWEDPMPAAQAAKGMSGLDYLKALAGRSFPPPSSWLP